MNEIFRDAKAHAEIADWFRTFGGFVAAADFAGARPMFEEDVIGFGTWMDVVEGRDRLETTQWRSIWPTIADFQFLIDTLQVRVSPDRRLAVAVIAWSSAGFHENGTCYPRPGRATVALCRDMPSTPWKGIHTHFSLNRGVPQQSFGKRPAGA